MKRVLIVIICFLVLTSCRYKRELEILHNTYWISQGTVLIRNNGKPSKSENIPDDEKTIHVFDESGIVHIYDSNGESLNSFRYEVEKSGNSISKILIKDKFDNDDTKYIASISPNILNLQELIIGVGEVASQMHLFIPLKDNLLIKKISE